MKRIVGNGTDCTRQKKKRGFAIKFSLNQMKKLQQNRFVFQLQGREDVES